MQKEFTSNGMTEVMTNDHIQQYYAIVCFHGNHINSVATETGIGMLLGEQRCGPVLRHNG